MVNRVHAAFRADDRSYFAILKKEIHGLAIGAGFSESKVGEIDIVVAELTSNLVKHADGGTIWVKLVEEDDIQGIEIIAIDNGPGMQDVSRMVADGVSTKNTLGHGLGAMKRLSNVFQVFSQREWGTIVLVRVFAEELPRFKKAPKVEVRSIVLPKPGEIECGDGFFYTATEDFVRLFLGDGLGHGPDAAAAVIKAGEAFTACTETDPVDIIRYVNQQVKKTRGLVGTVAVFNLHDRCWRICGVGNISTKIIGAAGTKNYTAYNGIIGLNVPNTLSAQEVPYEKGQIVTLCSDGLKARWDSLRFPSLLRYDLSVLPASLVKDYARNTDDMSAVACKINL